jgi:hypothetical protein
MQSSRLQIKVALTFVLAVLIAACAAPTAVVHEIGTNVPCPEWTTGQLGLAISVVPIAVPETLIASEGAVPGYGIQARRISIAVKPPRAAASARLIASTLSINILGGSFRDWAAPADQFADTRAGSKGIPANSRPRTVSSTQALEAIPGRVRVTPFLSGKRLHAQTQAIDVAIVPGGGAVDQSVVVTSSLWDKDKRPIAPAVRAVFTTPEAARAFTAWLQQVGGAEAGKYSLGLFTPANPNEKARINQSRTAVAQNNSRNPRFEI